jgi:hypothetical protein
MHGVSFSVYGASAAGVAVGARWRHSAIAIENGCIAMGYRQHPAKPGAVALIASQRWIASPRIEAVMIVTITTTDENMDRAEGSANNSKAVPLRQQTRLVLLGRQSLRTRRRRSSTPSSAHGDPARTRQMGRLAHRRARKRAKQVARYETASAITASSPKPPRCACSASEMLRP